mgnify:CR=1 FL=1
MGSSKVIEQTFGPALVAVDCTYLGCVESTEIALSETTRDLYCDKRKGRTGIFHYDAKLEVNIQALDFTMENLAIALDVDIPDTWGGTATSTLEAVSVDWSGSAGDWSGSVVINKEISGTVAWYTDAAGTTPWAAAESGTSTVIGPCLGQVNLTSSGTAEPTATLYATYAWGDQVPSGSSIVQPSFGSTSNDRYVVIIHKKAQQNTAIVWRIWRMQVVRDLTISYDNGSDDPIKIPIHLTGLIDDVGHPLVPLFDVSEVDMAALALLDPSDEPYVSTSDLYPIVS